MSSTVAYSTPRFASSRTRLMLSCASAALAAATAAIPQQAKADAFQGTITSNPNDVIRTSTGATTETLTVNSSNLSVVTWAPTDTEGTGSIDFLPSGNIATFQGGTGITDYTVLNMIAPVDPSRAIELNGTIFAKIDGGATGGDIWFYAPGGILVGSTALFDVGSLGLTTIYPSGLTVGDPDLQFSGDASQGGGGTITVEAGAQIKALANNSYVAMIAPRIEQGGNVRVNGSAAYVATEKVDMTMNDGLFNIQVPLDGGTTDANGIVHSGSTTGPTTGNTIYMVAVPKNEALTMLLGGTIGFDAASATVQNGQIILSSGWSVQDLGGGSINAGAYPGVNGNILIGADGATTFTSDVYGLATGNITALATAGDVDFDGDLKLQSFNSPNSGDILLGADSGYTLTVGGDVDVYSTNSLIAPDVRISASTGDVNIGGTVDLVAGKATDGSYGVASLYAFDGALTIGGEVLLSASAGAPSPDGESQSSDEAAGEVYVEAYSGGSITTGAMTLLATANGQDNNGGGDGTAGDGTGGTINIIAEGDGAITVNGNLNALADAKGGDMLNGGLAGGTGYGGTIYMRASGTSTIDINGDYFARALGLGGAWAGSPNPTVADGGDGHGGWSNIENDGGEIVIDGTLTLEAGGTGGNGQSGGNGFGGNAGIYGDAGSLSFGSNAVVSAVGVGGNAAAGFGGDGGDGYGGVAYIQADAYPGNVEVSPSAATITGGNATVDASGVGGNGGDGNGTIAAGNGGDGHGGLYTGESGTGGAFVLADAAGGTLTLSNTFLFAQGVGGQGGDGGTGQVGGDGGDGYGGTAQAGSYNPWGVTDLTGSATFADLRLDASAFGGNGGAGGGTAADGDGGSAFGGGFVDCGNETLECGGAFFNAKGTVTASNVQMYAHGEGGDGANGGYGQGGIVSVTVVPDSTMTLGSLYIDAQAFGGTGNSGSGGDAYGGLAAVEMTGGGLLSTTAGLTMFAGGEGGDGVTAGGDAFELTTPYGNIYVNIDGGTLDVGGSFNAFSEGYGGNATTGTGGFAQGGIVNINVLNGGLIEAGSIYASARAFGGASTSGQGGDAQGGESTVTADGGDIKTDGNLVITARADAGGSASGNGGNATGGDTVLDVLNGAKVNVGDFLNFDAAAFGGNGANFGGSAEAGTSTLTIDGGSLNANTIGVYANAWGGSGLDAGDAYGGDALIDVLDGGTLTTTGEVAVEGMGFGGQGIDNATGTGGEGGDGYGGTATVTIAGDADIGDLFVNSRGGGGKGGNGVNGGDGGAGIAGTSSLTITSTGSLTANDIVNVSRGFGGDGGNVTTGTGGNGGDATGGIDSLTVESGGSLTAASYLGSANAGNGYDTNNISSGGNGGSGGSGYGAGGNAESGIGTADIAGTATIANGFVVTSFASGGSGSIGGNADAGSASITVSGSLIAGSVVQASAQAQGGEGLETTGGSATGGTATLDVTGTVNVTGAGQFPRGINVFTRATGGDGVTEGGAATGGNSNLFVSQGANVTTTGLYVLTDAIGGNATNGVGGNAVAGFAQVDIGGNFTASGEAIVSSAGVGGDGTLGGGDGTGKDAAVKVHNAGVANFNGSLTIAATGTGGSSTSGDGGDGTGGYARTSVYLGGDMTVNNLTVDSSGTGGDGVNGGDGIALQSVNGYGGSVVQVFDAGSTMTLTGQTNVVSNGTGGDGTSGTGGDGSGGFASLQSFGSGTLAFNSASITANGTGGAGTGGAGSGSGGNAVLATDGSTATGTSATLSADGSTTGGTVNIGSYNGGSINLGSTTATANGGSTAGQVLVMAAGGTVDLGTASLSALGASGGFIQIYANGGDILADDLTLDSSDGIQLVMENNGNITVTNTLEGDALGVIALDDNSGGTLSATLLDLDAFDITNAADLAITNLIFNVIADFSVGNMSVAGSMSITSAGSLTTGDLSAGTDLSLSAGTDLTAGNLSAGNDVDASAGGDLSVQNVDAGNSATFVAGGLAGFYGVVAAPTITVTSGDITIGEGASLGVSGLTDLVTLNAVANGQAIILGDGGTAAPGQYELNELGEINSAAVVVNAIGGEGGTPDVLVYDYVIEGSQTDGGGVSSVTVNTNGVLQVLGDVQYVNAGVDDVLAFNAQTIEVITDTGSIVMTDSSGDLSGNLLLTAHDIWIADQSVIDQLEIDPNFSGLADALATNNGPVNQDGYVQAGGVTATMLGSSFLVQNSGTETDVAGITVGDGGLTVVNQGAEPATVIVNGQQVLSDGTIISGDAFAEAVDITGPTSGDSTVNGCEIGGCTAPPPPPPPPP
ncbi:MAG TPA: hypothetical protein VNR68_07900, partial [Sphingomicrobium sp.]|nr:hypothetical protein [Sphingomicrobium sp.]